MSNLEDRIRRIEDERDIQQTMYRYGYAIDYGSEDEWMNCWAADAILHWSDPPYRGHEQLRTAFRTHTHAPGVFHKHFLVNARISVLVDAAKAESMFARLDSYPDGPQILAFGRYLDKFIRCEDGCWRFSERVAAVESMRTPPEAVMEFMSSLNK
jgi:hypothetical protein